MMFNDFKENLESLSYLAFRDYFIYIFIFPPVRRDQLYNREQQG